MNLPSCPIRRGATCRLSGGAGSPPSGNSGRHRQRAGFHSFQPRAAITVGIPPSSAAHCAGTAVARRDGFNIQQRTVSGDIFRERWRFRCSRGVPFDARDDEQRAAARGGERQFCADGVSGHAASTASSDSVLQPAAARRSRSSASSAMSRSTCTAAPTLAVYHPHRQFANDRNWALSHVVATDASARAHSRGCARGGLGAGSGAGRAPRRANDGGPRARDPSRAIRARPDGGLCGNRSIARR